MRILTIDRSKWIRGKGSSLSRLYIPITGQMCCLGFWALDNGFTLEQISGQAVPDMVDPEKAHKLGLLEICQNHSFGRSIQGELTGTNDDVNITDEQREAIITKAFQQLGYDSVEFIN